MIEEEEDDEEILEKGITLKSALKHILVFLLIIVGALFIYFGFGPDQWSNLFIGFMLICFGTTLMQIQKQPPEPIRQTLTILACGICGLTKVRNYEQGDFVFKKVDKCVECKQDMEIKQIYSVKLKKPTQKEKERKLTPKPKAEPKPDIIK
ncbi:MAG: hypothetical protein GF383_11840 [Candidatus Lokiarchaeota archaeon]|nr:hypothetical protein [Candidatus Lokiarchaeota archaeon]MBD3341537.1 hypothetical protein [Candidatus Lokiarchaeota archaeon]